MPFVPLKNIYPYVLCCLWALPSPHGQKSIDQCLSQSYEQTSLVSLMSAQCVLLANKMSCKVSRRLARTQSAGFVCIAHRAGRCLNNKSSISATTDLLTAAGFVLLFGVLFFLLLLFLLVFFFFFCLRNCCANKGSFAAFMRENRDVNVQRCCASQPCFPGDPLRCERAAACSRPVLPSRLGMGQLGHGSNRACW